MIRKSVALWSVVIVATIAGFIVAPRFIGLTCDECGRKLADHTIVDEGQSYWGETWQHRRCPDGRIVAIRPH